MYSQIGVYFTGFFPVSAPYRLLAMQHATRMLRLLQHIKTDDTVNLVDPRSCVRPRPLTRQHPRTISLPAAASAPLPLSLFLVHDTLQYRFHALSASGLAQIDVFELFVSFSLTPFLSLSIVLCFSLYCWKCSQFPWQISLLLHLFVLFMQLSQLVHHRHPLRATWQKA